VLLIHMRDRRITAELDGDVIVDHIETDTRVPVSGTIHLLGGNAASPSIHRFTVRPVSDPPSGAREPTQVPGTTAS